MSPAEWASDERLGLRIATRTLLRAEPDWWHCQDAVISVAMVVVIVIAVVKYRRIDDWH
jgi:hypothetical protein